MTVNGQPQQQEQQGMPTWMKVAIGLAAVGAAGVGYKLYQKWTDTVYKGTEFPKAVRDRLIDEHWRTHKGYCPECGKTVPRSELTVDHIVPIRKGGKNSLKNAAVICRSCNCRKSDKYSLADQFFGRGGSRPRRRKPLASAR